jgi:enterochelin esterase-like enzyme
MSVASSVRPTAPSATEPIPQAAAYVMRGRDLRIDFLRGLCVIAMMVDHIAGASWLYAITGGNRFYISAAEGFIFVSGLVAGRAYTRFIERDGLSYGLNRVLKRAAQLYLLAVTLTLLFVPLSEVFQLPWALGWNVHDAVDFVVSVVTLHRTYYLVDVMLLYVLLLVSAALAFVLLARGHSTLVLGGSWLLWLGYQVFPEQVTMPWPIGGNNLFYFAAWQVLFFTGLVLGHEWERAVAAPSGSGRVQRILGLVEAAAWRRRVLRIGAAVLAIIIAIYALQDVLLGFAFRGSTDPAAAQAGLLATIFGKSDVRFGRLAVFAVVFVVFFLATTEWWDLLRRGVGWLVLPLGQNALFAYSAHVLIALAVAYQLQRTVVLNDIPARENAAIQIAGVLLVWALVQIRPVRSLVSIPRVGYVTPVVLGIAALVLLPRFAPDTGQSLKGNVPVAAANAGSSADAVIAHAYGTAIPAGVEPDLPAEASAPPVAQPTIAQPTVAPAATATPGPAGSTLASILSHPSSAAGTLQGGFFEPEFFSAALNTRERYFIYLPPGYQSAGKRYPVLYMLHGGGGRGEWIGYGLISTADGLIASGKLPPMIIVLPQGDQGYWVNHMNGGPRWGDYLSQDIVKLIDSTYPTMADASHRAVGGMSMGGWGALYQAFTHPDEFGVAGGHAASLRDGSGSMPFLPKGDAFNTYDPVQLAGNASGLNNLHVWVDADDQDPWVKRDADLHSRLDQRHISNEYHVFPGKHGGTYWHDHVQDYLNFYAHALASS